MMTPDEILRQADEQIASRKSANKPATASGAKSDDGWRDPWSEAQPPRGLPPSNRTDEQAQQPSSDGFGARLKQGVGRAVDYAQVALSGDEGVIAKVAADQQRNALPQTALQRQMAEELAPYNEAAKNAEGFADSARAWGSLGLKRAGQLLSNPAEAGKMMIEQVPNSIPGLAGGFAGAKAGVALGAMTGPFAPVAIPVGGVLGGVAGGFAGGYGIEKGASVIEQVQEKAHQQGVDLQDQVAARGFVAKNLDEIDAAATRKGVGTAGTDAVLNALTMGALGLSGRGIVKEARALAKAVDDGVVSAADATAALARLEAANAARNTVGQKALRGGAVVGAEMTGEGVSEAVGQKYAYGEVDPGQVIDEAFLGLGQGAAMVMGGKAFRKAVGLPDNNDAATRSLDDVHSALAQNAGLPPDGAPNDGDSGGVDAQAGNPAFDSTNAPAPFINQGVMDVNGLGPRPPAPVLDTQRLDALLEPQRPSEAMGLRTGPDAGPLENAAALSVDTGATAQMQGAAGQAQAAPGFTTIQTIYGDSVTVRTSDLNSDETRLRRYTRDGKSEEGPAIHRDSLDPTGEKSAALAEEVALFNAAAGQAQQQTAQEAQAANAMQAVNLDAVADPYERAMLQRLYDDHFADGDLESVISANAELDTSFDFGANVNELLANAGVTPQEIEDAQRGQASAQAADRPGQAQENDRGDFDAELSVAKNEGDGSGRLAGAEQGEASQQPLDQQAAAPGSQAEGANVATLAQLNRKKLAEMTDDELQQLSSLLPADHSRQQKIQKAIQTRAEQSQAAINQGVKADGTQTDQAQQAVAQPTQAGAAQTGQQTTPVAASPNATPDAVPGQVKAETAAKATPGAAQPADNASPKPAATWATMPTEARQQVARAAGLNPVQTAKALKSGSIEEMPAAIADKLAPVLSSAAGSQAQPERAQDVALTNEGELANAADTPADQFGVMALPEQIKEYLLKPSVTMRQDGKTISAKDYIDGLLADGYGNPEYFSAPKGSQAGFLSKPGKPKVTLNDKQMLYADAAFMAKKGKSGSKPKQPQSLDQQVPATTNQSPANPQEGNDAAQGQPQASTKPESEIKKGDARALFSGKAMDRTRKAVPADARAMEQFIADGKEAELQRLLSIRQTGHDNLTDEETNRFYDLRTERNQAKAAVENAGRGQIKPKQSAATEQQAAPGRQSTESAYTLPSGSIGDEWRDDQKRSPEHPDFTPTPRQQRLMDEVKKVLDGGAFYNDDVTDKVAKALGVSDEVLASNRTGVKNGDFGYDVYHARQAVQAQALEADAAKIRAELNLRAGDKLGTLIFNDFKQTNSVEVVSVTEDGRRASLKGKRGAATVTFEVTTPTVKFAIERAHEKGKRKDSYEEFIAGRAVGNQAVKESSKLEVPSQPDESIMVDGLRVSPTTVKLGDSVKPMWKVQSAENAEREKRGERQLGGDSLHDTKEQAIAAAERESKHAAEQQAAKAEQDAADKARLDAEEARKAVNRPKSVVERRRDAILDGPSKIGQGTKRAFITAAVDNGYAIEAKMVYDYAAKKRDQEAVDRASRAGYILGLSNENIPAVKAGNEAAARLKEGKYEKPEYRVYQGSDTKAPFREITKTEYDYAQELKAQRASAQKAQEATKQLPANLQEGDAEAQRFEVGKFLTNAQPQDAPATHADPGQAPEAATPAVVAESLQKASRNEDTKPSEMRKWLAAEIDKELLQASDRPDYDEAVKIFGEKDAINMFTGNGPLGKNSETGFVTFDVPGDGKYKVRNSVRGLLEFRKNVMASSGFKDNGQKQVKPEQNQGVQGGSGGKMAAITNMIEEGDFEAARDYAEAVGIKLEDVKVPRGDMKPAWEKYLKDGTLPPAPDTRPQPAPKTAAQMDEDVRQEAGTDASEASYRELIAEMNAKIGERQTSFDADIVNLKSQHFRGTGVFKGLRSKKAKDEAFNDAVRELRLSNESDQKAILDEYRAKIDAHPYDSVRRAEGARKTREIKAQMEADAARKAAQPVTRADVEAAQQQAAAIIGSRIDAMSAGDVNKIAKKFLPTMGIKPTMSKANNKEAMTDSGINLEAAAAEVGATLPAEVTRALQADMEGRMVGGEQRPTPQASAVAANPSAKNEARQPLTPDSAQNTRFGDVVVDGQGQEYVVAGQRHKWLEVAPFVDGRPQISATTTLKFHLEPETAASYEGERRSDPLYTTGRNYFDELKAKEASVQSENTPEAQAESKAPTEPSPLEHTPKQYADAWLRWSAETNSLPLAEVREMQGDEAGLKAIEQRWVDAVVQEANSGQPLPAKTLDKLLEVRPNAQLPESAIPDGYQRPEARKAEKEEAAARKVKPEAIEDFGEKLEGARKDLPPSLKEEVSDEQMASLPLSKIWPANAHEEIQNDAAAALAFAARQEIPAKPRQSVKVQRWVQKVKNFRALVTSDDALAGNLDKLGLDGLSQRVGAGSVLEGFFAKVRLLAQLPRDTWGRVEKVGEYPDAVRYGEDGQKTPIPFSAVVIDGEAHQFDGAKNIGPDEVSKIKELLGAAAPKKGGLTEADFEIRTYKNRAESFINRKGDKEMRPLKTFTGQESGKQAREWLKANAAQAEAQWEAVKARDNVGKSDVRTAQNRQRVGADHRKGADVTAQMFEDTFGFRGVQFGNWVAQGAGAKDRQGLLNEAYDALMDLSLLLGVPSRAMSLDGSLGLSLGARGSGKAAAHFEHDSLVINLTKTKGAGSLAHEWFHALDNYFRRQRGGMDKQAGREDAYITYKPEAAWVPKAGTRRAAAPLTSGQLRQWLQARGMYDSGKSLEENAQAANFERDPQHKDGVRPQVEAAFAQLVQALNDSPMAARATVLDGGATKGYWGRIIERGARSFENYVINKMALQGYSNDFLANIRSFDEWQALGKNAERYPYLTPAEEGPVVEAFDNLFGTIETRQGDDGNVELYYAANPARRPGTAQDKAVMRAIADGKNARDVLRLIANGSKDPFLRQVAKMLLKAGITPNIQFGYIGKTEKGDPIHGQYRGKSDTIAIAGSAEYAAERIFMHEAMHAATMRALKKGGLVRVQLQKLLEHVRKQPGAAGFYGLKNLDEFVVEVFTNPDFQAALRKMSAPAGNSLKSAWHSFVRILRSILGLSNDSSSALAQALELGVEAVRQDMVLRSQGAQATRTANAGQDGGRGVGDADPAEARRVQSAIEGKSLLDAARFLTQSSNKARAAVAQKVLEKLERLERAGVSLQLNIVHRGDMAPAAMANARGYTETGFDSKGRDIAVWLNGADVTGKVGTEEEVLLHELVHATTSGMVFYGRNQPKSLAGKHVRDLMAVTDAIASHISQRFTDADAGKATLTEFEQDMRAGANNAFRSDDEVLAWALTNSEAQQYLETIPYKSGSLWSNFVQSVRSLLGLSPANDTALSEVLRVSERLLTDDAPDAGRAAFWHKRGLPMVQQQGRGSQAFTSQRGDGNSTIDQTETEAFKRWFKDSKVVDADGKPLRVYHGTNADFNAFDPGKLGMTTGAASASYGFFFASNPKTASYYATGNPRLDDLHRRVNAAQGSQEGGKLLKQLVDLQSDIKRQTTGQNPITQRMAEVRRQLSRYAIDISRDMTAKQERDEWGHVDQSPADERWQLIQEYKTLHEQERAAGIEVGIGENGRVIPVYLSIKNPLVYDYKGRSYRDKSYAEILQQAIDGGHDGVILRNTYDSGPITHDERDETDIYVAFRPEQVKSATGNNGNFDPEDADILNFGADNFAALKASALDQISQTLSHPGKVSLWDKTVGTMRNLAERVPQFKPVFEAAQRFIDDVSMLANDAADFAPRLIPRVETWRDLFKKPITAADNKAVAKPLFEGTLMWARDLDGTPVTTEALNAKYRNTSADKKARIMLRTGKLDERVLKMWMGMPIESYEKAVASRFDSTILKPGVVWSQKELKEIFKLGDKQVSLYQEARAAIDRSLDMTARTDMLRLLGDEFPGMRSMVLEQESLKDAFNLVVDTLQEEARANPDMADRLMDINNSVVNRYETATELMEKGYAPLSRFGKYTVDVVDANGERQYFGMFESIREANQMAMKMRDVFNGAAVTQGTMSEQAFKLFQGITPESLEMFGSMLGLKGEGSEAQDKAFQAYLQLAKNNHSALKRLIHRKGIDGYSEDVGRVLSSFVYSNARLGSQGLNAGTMETAIEGIPKEMGELRDVAMGLRNYIQDPQEEGQAVRGMLFAQYLGGSVASAFVNMTQPFQITMPWLSQYGGMGQAAKQMARALKDMGTKGFKYEADLAKALQSAEDDGVVSPQEIHQLQAQARGTGSLRTGDGTKLGDARAAAANNWERVKVAWGQPFALAEQFNRRSTFIASYRIAKAQGMADPAEFARHAVLETQFLYSKANKMRWGRGAIGGTLMTFKTYSVSYLEVMHRMWNQGEAGSPERAAGRRAVGWAVAMLLLMGGAGGLPFMEDAEDLIDGAAQLMGYNLSTKQARKEFLADIVGKEMAGFMEHGVSGLPGAPIDVSGRLGMGNLIPGTGLFMSKQNRERDLMEIAGPAGDLVARGFTGARKALTGDIAGAALEVSPTAVRNWHKGYDMATSGIYKDTKGYKVMDVTLGEAISKFAGFQPKSVADDGKASNFKQRTKSFYIQTSADIKAQWADAVFRKDDAALERVRERLAAWNRNNPSLPITVKIPDIMKRVREMGKDREQRINDTAPKALRQQFREMSLEASR